MQNVPDKVDRWIADYKRLLKKDDQLLFLLAICYLKNNNYLEAYKLFDISLEAMLIPPMSWKDSGQLNWLVDICILSGKEERFPDILREFAGYRKAPTPGITVTAEYGYAMMELLLPTGWDIFVSINELLKRPKWKLWYAIGEVLQSVVNKDSNEFNTRMIKLLEVHERIAKMGGLRESAEGLICMQGMSLAYVARKRDMKIEIENEYLPLSYLDYVTEVG